MELRNPCAALTLACATVLLSAVAPLSAASAESWMTQPSAGVQTIANDRGGYLAAYVDRLAQLQIARQKVSFAGRCDSACTLLLALPRNQTCVTPTAFFGFHAPKAPTPAGAEAAETYLMHKYPAWVRDWIASQGGLTSTLAVMDYAYASRFLKPCN